MRISRGRALLALALTFTLTAGEALLLAGRAAAQGTTGT